MRGSDLYAFSPSKSSYQYQRPFFNKIFGAETVSFQKLPEIVNRYLVAPDPIILHYLINPAVPPPERPSAWDVEVKMEDSALKHRMAVTVATSKESAQTLVKIDEEVSLNTPLGSIMF